MLYRVRAASLLIIIKTITQYNVVTNVIQKTPSLGRRPKGITIPLIIILKDSSLNSFYLSRDISFAWHQSHSLRKTRWLYSKLS